MIYNNMEFLNTASLERREGVPGLIIQRFPEKVRHKMGMITYEKGRFKAQVSTGCEIRFITDSSAVRVLLTAIECDGDICVYIGDYFHSIHHITAGAAKPIFIELSDNFQQLQRESTGEGRYSNKLWRFVIGRGVGAMDIFSVALQDVDTFGYEIRPPEKGDIPGTRWLAYGSSITHGSGATVNHNSYIQQTARRLGIDVLNKGIGGSCHCEPEVADYIADEVWDLATLEIGVNMREHFTTGQFRERAEYLISKALKSHPGKPVVIINIFPNYADLKHVLKTKEREVNCSFRKVLREIYREFASKDLYLIEGDTILTDMGALTYDLIHPSDYGHILMGQNLEKQLRPILNRYGFIK